MCKSQATVLFVIFKYIYIVIIILLVLLSNKSNKNVQIFYLFQVCIIFKMSLFHDIYMTIIQKCALKKK